MAGYKQTILNLKPICFLTFDSDTLYNKANGQLIYKHIHDESNNGHVGILQTNDDEKKSYLMGQPSLVERERNTEQASIIFAPYGYDPDSKNDFAFEKSMVEVLHTDKLLLPDDYTIMFLFNKKTDESELRRLKWNEAENKYEKRKNYSGATLYRTLIRKGNPIEVSYIDMYRYEDQLSFKFPGYSHNINLSDIIGVSDKIRFHNNIWHVTMTHKVLKHHGNIYQNVYSIYINGILNHRHYGDKSFTFYNAESTSPVEIGGNRDSSDPDTLNDRQTSPLTIDQFAIFDKCLTDYQVMDCFKKTVPYDRLIRLSEPDLYVPFNDKEATNTNDLNIAVTNNSYYTSVYSNKYPFIRKEQLISSDRLGLEVGAQFFNANAKIQDNRYYSTVINSGGDYSIEFWASFTDTERCILISCQDNVAPFKGVLVEGNRLHNDDRPGMVQVRFDENLFLTAPEYDIDGSNVSYNDGIPRHYVITRSGTVTRFYIDGEMVSYFDRNVDTLVTGNSSLYFMGASPSDTNTNGLMGHFVFYKRALGLHEIIARSFFKIKMVIKGNVTVQGVPHKADIRIYSHHNGELLYEYESDTNGDYFLDVYTNNYIDMIFLDKEDSSIQMKIVGPVLAHEYIDE